MPNVDRVSLPEEFYDITSTQLLAQPEPQYLYAQMTMAALRNADLRQRGELGMAGRALSGVGADYAGAEKDRLMLSNPLMSGVFGAKVDFNGVPGTVVRLNRPTFADTTYTLASREVGANATISTTAINAGSEQTSITLKRFAGPYDSTNSRVAPFGLDKFAAGQSVHDLTDFVGTHMRRDYHKFLDAVQVTLLDNASTTVRPVGMTTDDTATAAGDFPLDLDTLIRAEESADNANLPVFADGYRIIVLTPTQCAQLKTDSDYIELSKAHPEYSALFPQYVASVGKLHVFKSTTLSTANNTNSIPIHKGHLIAPGALGVGMGAPPRVASSSDDNYGEAAKSVWISYMGFELLDNRFVISVRSTNSAS